MKQLFYFLFALSFFNAAYSQNVAINTDGSIANNSAMLDIKSTTKGMLIPRMTTGQRISIASPATGLLVYDTDANSFWFYNGSAWTNFSATGGGANGINWKLSGNDGTNPSSDFIGTTDNQSLVFKVNNDQHGKLGKEGNVFFGKNAGFNNEGHYGNIAIGSGALFTNGRLNNLVAIGDSALFHNNILTSYDDYPQGTENTAVGSKALFSNTDGFRNTAFGSLALYSNTRGNLNSAFGTNSLYNNTGSTNSAFGNWVLRNNTQGSANTAIGTFAMLENTTGQLNVAVGFRALDANVTGSNNTAIGYNADVNADNLTNATAIGANAVVNTSNKVVIGNSSVISIGGFANWSNFSDGRFKQNVKEDVPGLSFINKLRPVTYTLNIDAINEFNSKDLPADKKQQVLNADKKKEVYTGFMAQEVEQAARSLNYNFSGIDKPKDESKQTYALRYSDFVVPLVKAIQEQQKMIDDLKKEIEALKKNN